MGEQVDFWDLEDEVEEEELLSLKLAADKIATEIDKAIKALKKDEPDWDAAKTAVEAARKSYEGYAYGYAAPDEPRLKGRFEAALKAIEDKNAKLAIGTLEKIKASRYSKPQKPEKEEKAERKQQAEEAEERVKLAGGMEKVGNEYQITIMDPGEANGYTWPAEVLERDLAVFDNVTSFTNHERRDVMAARPGGRTINDICGVSYEPRWDGAILGSWRAMPPQGDWVAFMIEQIIEDRERGLAVPDVGVSADVSFAHRNGVVTRLLNAHSVDIVFNAARGPGHGEAFARVANAVQQKMTGGDEVTDQEREKEKREREQKLKEERALLAVMSENIIDQRISVAELPTAAADRVRAQFADVVVLDVEALDKAIQNEREYLASLIEDDVVKGMGAAAAGEGEPPEVRTRLGGSVLKVGNTPMERVQAVVDRMFGLEVENPADVPRVSLGQLYADLTGDVGVTGAWNIPEAIERTGLANITDTTFGDVVADAINKVVIHAWQMVAAEGYEWYKKVFYEADFASVHEVDWITYGGFGDLPELAAGQEYPELTISDLDTSEDTGNWVKPGGLISIPIETFDKGGKTGAFKALPKALGVAAVRNLSAKCAAVFSDNAGVGPTLQDGSALFHSNHSNLATTALSYPAWVAVNEAQFKQTEQNSAKRMGFFPWGMLVPVELRGLARQIVPNEYEYNSADNNPNAYQLPEDRVIVVPDWADATDWATFLNPELFPAVGIGYRYGRKPQVIAEPGGAGSYGRFTQDVIRWKVMWQYVVSVINYRGLQKRNVA